MDISTYTARTLRHLGDQLGRDVTPSEAERFKSRIEKMHEQKANDYDAATALYSYLRVLHNGPGVR